MSRRKGLFALICVLTALACGDGTNVPLEPRATGAGALTGASPATATHPKLTLTVVDVTTGLPIVSGSSVAAGHLFQVSVATNGVDCSGQFVVTALGAIGFPPSVLVQFAPFTIGPAVGQNTASGGVLTANPLVNPPNVSTNDWKISATCNAAAGGQFDSDRAEFFAVP